MTLETKIEQKERIQQQNRVFWGSKRLTRKDDSLSADTITEMSLVSFFIFLNEATTAIGTARHCMPFNAWEKRIMTEKRDILLYVMSSSHPKYIKLLKERKLKIEMKIMLNHQHWQTKKKSDTQIYYKKPNNYTIPMSTTRRNYPICQNSVKIFDIAPYIHKYLFFSLFHNINFILLFP